MALNERSSKQRWVFPAVTAVVVLGALAFVIESWVMVRRQALDHWGELPALGQYGDTFGRLSALFTGLALIGAALAVVLQWKALREERDAGRKEAVESRFFQLLRNLQTLVNETRIGTYVGHQAMRKIEWTLVMELADRRNRPNAGPELSEKDRRADINAWFNDFYDGKIEAAKEIAVRYGDILGHIFRLTYHILRAVDRSEITQEEKNEYAKLLRAHLSNPELVLLLYNCQSEHGYPDHYQLVEKYNMLKNINLKAIEKNPNDKLLYPSLVNPQAASN